jgi:hypothetical protein
LTVIIEPTGRAGSILPDTTESRRHLSGKNDEDMGRPNEKTATAIKSKAGTRQCLGVIFRLIPVILMKPEGKCLAKFHNHPYPTEPEDEYKRKRADIDSDGDPDENFWQSDRFFILSVNVPFQHSFPLAFQAIVSQPKREVP